MQEANTYRAAKGGRGTENGERDTACPVLPTHHFVRLQRRQRQQQQHKNEGKRIKCLSYYSVNSILCIYGNQPNQFQRPLLLCTVSTIRVHWLANIVTTHKRKKEKKKSTVSVLLYHGTTKPVFIIILHCAVDSCCCRFAAVVVNDAIFVLFIPARTTHLYRMWSTSIVGLLWRRCLSSPTLIPLLSLMSSPSSSTRSSSQVNRIFTSVTQFPVHLTSFVRFVFVFFKKKVTLS